jgi:hypothetical protein
MFHKTASILILFQNFPFVYKDQEEIYVTQKFQCMGRASASRLMPPASAFRHLAFQSSIGAFR